MCVHARGMCVCEEWERTKEGVVTVECVFLLKYALMQFMTNLGHKILLYGFSE